MEDLNKVRCAIRNPNCFTMSTTTDLIPDNSVIINISHSQYKKKCLKFTFPSFRCNKISDQEKSGFNMAHEQAI